MANLCRLAGSLPTLSCRILPIGYAIYLRTRTAAPTRPRCSSERSVDYGCTYTTYCGAGFSVRSSHAISRSAICKEKTVCLPLSPLCRSATNVSGGSGYADLRAQGDRSATSPSYANGKTICSNPEVSTCRAFCCRCANS